MPETSIVVKATDRYSESVKKMATVTKSFGKDVDRLEEHLYALGKNKNTLKLDLSKAKEELKEAEKQFKLTGAAADGLKLELAQANYDNISRNLKTVTSAAKDAEKAISKIENKSSSQKLSVSNVAEAISASGISKMAGEFAANLGTSIISSAGGDTAGIYASSIISSAATGAAMGSIIPIIGTALGAVIGAGVGTANAWLQVYKNKDDAFKSYVQESYDTVTQEQADSLTSGSTIAGSREQTHMAFSKRLGSDEAATEYLDRVKEMARHTNYTYDEITGYSKLLLNTYDSEKTLSVLTSLSDATAGLNLDSNGVQMFINGLSRMRTTGKVTQEYLNYFSERGLDVYQALANYTGADKSKIAGMVTDGQIGGTDAAEAILAYINETYGGLSEKLATTYDAMVDNLADYQADMDAAMGEGYNEERKKGIQAQMDWMEGESGEAVKEANKAIGAWKAELENKKERYEMEAVNKMMFENEDYQKAKAEGNAAEMGRLIMQAKVQGMNEYNASAGAQEALEAERVLIEGIREDSKVKEEYWNAGYLLGLEFTKGLMAARSEAATSEVTTADTAWLDPTAEPTTQSEYEAAHRAQIAASMDMGMPSAFGYATGIDYVPYDNFPALLHQGERVLTAVEARSGHGGSIVQIEMHGTVIREDADIDRVAEALLQKMELAGKRG